MFDMYKGVFSAYKLSLGIITSICAISFGASVSFASSEYSIMQCHTGTDSVSIYIDSNDEKIESADCQVGRFEAEKVEVSPISDREVPLRTLFLLDNSLSITEKYRPLISEILTETIGDHLEGEEFRIATIDTEIHYLSDYTTDYEALTDMLNSVGYDNQDTYFTDLVYYALKDLYEDDEEAYSRIVVISDGADDMSIGIKSSEVTELAHSSNIPVYSIGVKYKNNEDRLKNMFAISRSTGALYYNLDDSTAEQVVQGLSKDRKLTEISVYPQAEQLDGSTKSLKIVTHSSMGDKELHADAQMPFGTAQAMEVASAAEEKTEEEAAQEASSLEEESAAESSEEKADENKSTGSPVSSGQLVLALVIILAGIILLLLQKKKKTPDTAKTKAKKTENKKKEVKKSASANKIVVPVEEKEDLKTQFEDDGRTVMDDSDDKTVMGDESSDQDRDFAQARKNVYLSIIKKNDSSDVKRFSLERRVVIGRDKKYNDYSLPDDKRVSGQHCYVEMGEDGKFYIYDLNSTNGLLCDGHKVSEKAEVKDGSIIKLGSTELVIKIQK